MFGVCLRRCLLYPSATVINNNCRNGLLPSVLPSKSFCAAASCWPPPEKIQEIIDTTLQSKPKGRTQWSCRSLAQRLGVSKSTVNNIWRSHNLKPHRVKTFKLSRDLHFLEKLTDVVGLYLN